MTENALVIRDEMSLQDTMTLGKTLAASGFFSDAKQAAQAVVKILAGRELGFGPIASMTGINVIQGKIAIGANLLSASVKRDPRYDYKVVTLDDDGCELVFFENGKEVGRSTFTMQNARETMYWNSKTSKMEPLADKFNWRSYQRNMCFARAMSNGVKWYCPDATGGAPIYTPEELGATVDGEGDVVTVPSRVVQPRNATQAVEQAYGTEPETTPEPATVATPKPPILGLPADTGLVYTPEWLDDDTPRQWGKLYFEARKLGFTSDFHVEGALKHLFPSDDDKAETWKEEAYRTVWCMLQEHQRSKVGEAQ